jgi:hypothetical protein
MKAIELQKMWTLASRLLMGLGMLVAATLMATEARATTTYTYHYTGNNYSYTTGIYSSGGPYHAEIEFTTTTPLAPNLPLGLYLLSDLTSFTFNDGPTTVDVFSSYNSGFTIEGIDMANKQTSWYFQTDGTGNIIQWDMGVNVKSPDSNYYAKELYSNNSSVWIVMDLASTGYKSEENWDFYTPFPNNEARSFSPGTWTRTVSDVPEPSTFGLMGLSLLGLGTLAKKRKRQS